MIVHRKRETTRCYLYLFLLIQLCKTYNRTKKSIVNSVFVTIAPRRKTVREKWTNV